MGLHARRPGRRRFGLLSLPLAVLVLVPFAVMPSAAAWTDVERVNGTFRSSNCAAGTGYTSTGAGRLINGTVLGTPLSSIASINGATATSPGTGTTVTSANPISVSALGGINTQLAGPVLLDTGAQAGALQQYAEARPSGWSGGSAGSVANAGALNLVVPPANGVVPRFATVQLGSILTQLVGGGVSTGVTNLTDASLSVGAVASYATLDGCAADWSNNVYTALDRKYLVAGMSATLTSPLVSAITTTTNTGAANIRTLVQGVAGQTGLINSISGATLTALSTTLNGFLIGTPVTTLALDINLGGLATNLATPISDAAGIATINLGAGTVTVDLARLLGPSYQNSVGLNGLAPNTQLLLNSTAMSALVGTVGTALTSWITNVQSTANAAGTVIDVDLKVAIPLSVGIPILGINVPVATVNVTASHVGLDKLIAGTAPISVTLQLLGTCPGAGIVVCGVVNPLVNGLTSALTTLVLNGILGPSVGNLLKTALTPLPGLATLVTNLTTASSALTSFLSSALGSLFGPTATLSLVVNAQNAPNPAEVSAPPGALPGWTGLAAPSTNPYRTGQFSVAALRLVTLGFLTTGVGVDLARSTVGSNGPVP
jgi:hypothetical protein